jgi:hypothetical protein
MKIFKLAMLGVAGVAIAGFLAVTALGSGITSAQEPDGSGGGHARPFTRALADVLGITPSQLQQDRQAALDQVLQTAVAEGRITQEQADKIREHPRAAARLLRSTVYSVFDAAAETLQMTNEELRAQLANGNSLAGVAAQQNVSVDQLKAGITTQVTAKLDEAVADGRISQEQETKLLDGLAKRLDTMISREGGKHVQP